MQVSTRRCRWTTTPPSATCEGRWWGSGAQWSGQLAATMYSVLATLGLWQINARTWLGAYLQVCADNGNRAPADLGPFLPWVMNEDWPPCAPPPPVQLSARKCLTPHEHGLRAKTSARVINKQTDRFLWCKKLATRLCRFQAGMRIPHIYGFCRNPGRPSYRPGRLIAHSMPGCCRPSASMPSHARDRHPGPRESMSSQASFSSCVW